MIRLGCFSVGLFLVLAGCRTQPYVNAHIESVNAEYRELEDYVYCLEEENARLVQEMDSIRQRGSSSGSEKSGTGGGIFRRGRKGAPDSGSPQGRPGSTTEPPMIEVPGGSSPATPRSRSTLQRPELNSPAETPPSLEPPQIELPAPMGAIPATSNDTRLASAEEPLPLSSATTKAAPSDNKVTHIALNPLLTGGADFDGQPGDEGLCVVLEPRNAANQYLPQSGAVSVVVLDPARQGDAARIARWDFDSSAVQDLLQKSQAARGIKLELPWPAAPPASSNLKLFVRYETADGRKLQTDRDVLLTPAGQTASRWMPRPPDRQRPAIAAATSTAALPATASTDQEVAQRPRPTWSPHR